VKRVERVKLGRLYGDISIMYFFPIWEFFEMGLMDGHAF
jgi:hypothetical protein